MNNVLGFLEAKLMPLAAKTAQQRHLGAIRGAYVSFMPFIIVGSILLVISSFPNQNYQQFMSQAFGESWSAIIEIPFNAVFSTMSLFYQFPGRISSGGTLRRRSHLLRHSGAGLFSDPYTVYQSGGKRRYYRDPRRMDWHKRVVRRDDRFAAVD
ncbi:cellobiose phosphotransferase system IIC component [Citrobacter koseri]|uniref:Cellobiose phosphotransferase system IIC component n=1 Tax=Citrobacter koseri TaxID=545 RepID=A0A2X2VSP6_CITKO|nr:cellobiose phosphotransferase system IIC component [Citrobacter koseri]